MSKANGFAMALGHVLTCLDDEEFRYELNINVGDDLIEDLYNILLEFVEKSEKDEQLLH
jgi:hypothetical protein